MPAPASIAEFIDLGCKAGLLDRNKAGHYCQMLGGTAPGQAAKQLAGELVRAGLLTSFQAEQLLLGRWHGFTLSNKYRLLDCIGSGGMGRVYLCQHLRMRRLVAIKILPAVQAQDAANLERFRREARAVAALNHPNIVRAHDIDQDGGLHYLVMEYVDGESLAKIVQRKGPFDVYQAAHCVSQIAAGLQHAHEAGLAHRDIKPANLLLDRHGVVKILDLGLARFFRDAQDDLTAKHDGAAVLGTADYLAPEQIENSAVDIRADIYSLGCTFYFLLAGHAPFHDRSVAQKLLAHQMKSPRPMQSLRRDVPNALAAVLNRMLAKRPAERFQQPQELVIALLPWTQQPTVRTAAPHASSRVPLQIPHVPDQSAASGIVGNWALPVVDISELPTAISRQPFPQGAPDANGQLPTPLLETSSVAPLAADGSTITPSSAAADTDPFALAGVNAALISEDSVFCAQFSGSGSTKRSRTGPAQRGWPLPVALAVLAGLVGVGGWQLWMRFVAPAGQHEKNAESAALPISPAPAEPNVKHIKSGPSDGVAPTSFAAASAPITSIALSPNGKTILVASRTRTPKLWDTKTGQFRGNLLGHAQTVNQVVFAPDGDTALTASQDHSLYLWDIKYGDDRNGSHLVHLTGHSLPVTCAAFVPGSTQAVSGGEDRLLHLWDLKSGNKLRAFTGHAHPVRCVAVAADGRRMASGSADGSVRLWDLGTGQTVHEWKHHHGPVRAVAFGPLGRLVASAGSDGEVHVCDADTHTERHSFSGGSASVTQLCFSGDGRSIIASGSDGSTRVWALASGKEVHRFADVPGGVVGLSMSADGCDLAIAGADQEVRICPTPSFLHVIPAGLSGTLVQDRGPVEAVAFAPGGKLAASAGHDRVIRIWDVAARKQIRELAGHQDAILSVCFTKDGQHLLSAGRDRTLRVWDVDKGALLLTSASETSINEARFSADERFILSAGASQSLLLWQAAGGKLSLARPFVGDTKLYPLPTVLAPGLVGLLGAPSGDGWLRAAALLPGGQGPIWSVDPSPDGQRFVSASSDRTVRSWDVAGKQLARVDTPTFEPKRVRFAPDGSLLLAGDLAVHQWRFQPDGTIAKHSLIGHTSAVVSLAISQDGNYALSGDISGNIIVWDLPFRRPLQFFAGHKGAVKDLAIAPDLTQAASAGDDGSVRVWNLPPCLANAKPNPK